MDFPGREDEEYKGAQSCGTNKTVWVPENPIPYDVYGNDARNCEGSTYEFCSEDGDHYNAAKRYCESNGTHLATLGELKSLGYTDGKFWAAEEMASYSAYRLINGHWDNDSKNFGNAFVCIGN